MRPEGFALTLESSICAVETFPTPMCVVYSVVWFVYTVCKSPLKRKKKSSSHSDGACSSGKSNDDKACSNNANRLVLGRYISSINIAQLAHANMHTHTHTLLYHKLTEAFRQFTPFSTAREISSSLKKLLIILSCNECTHIFKKIYAATQR